jgi:peptide/nickel transport system substrate-binding protein
MRAVVLLQEQFRRIGADVQVEQTDFGGFVQRFTDRKYDAVMGSWHADPGPASVRDSWGSSGAVTGGNNTGAYRSAAFDAAVDSGAAARTPDAMRRHFAAAWRIISDDAPAIWLAEPRAAIAVNTRIETTGMRPDAWWAGIARWRIPTDKRIARDVPAGTTGAPR